MNAFNPANYDYNKAPHTKQYAFEDPTMMAKFTHGNKSNPFITKIEMADKQTLSVEYRDESGISHSDKIYNDITGEAE